MDSKRGASGVMPQRRPPQRCRPVAEACQHRAGTKIRPVNFLLTILVQFWIVRVRTLVAHCGGKRDNLS
jgi:hypothetical protein